ncbi:MAG: hypothetical protein RQ750_12510 [Roseovarius sp.]|nr:hypothetical protein [Roseovarius sp.]
MSITNFHAEPKQPQWFSEVPRSITRLTVFGIFVMVVSFGGFGAWAFKAPLAADALTDDSQIMPQEVYLARVRVPAEEFARIRNFTPTPGMPAQVMILSAERTFFEYLTRQPTHKTRSTA